MGFKGNANGFSLNKTAGGRDSMNIFEEYLMEELKSEFERTDLNEAEYLELLERFEDLAHLEEARIYLNKMKKYSYQDYRARIEEKEAGEAATAEVKITEKEAFAAAAAPVTEPTPLRFRDMEFTDGKISGRYFYKNTRWIQVTVNFDPFEQARRLTVGITIYRELYGYDKYNVKNLRFPVGSKIFYADRETESESYAIDFDVEKGDTWVRTMGIAPKDSYDYRAGNYLCELKIEGQKYYDTFTVYDRILLAEGVGLKSVKLYESDEDARLGKNEKTTFCLNGLSYIYFKFFLNKSISRDDYILPMKCQIVYAETGEKILDEGFFLKPEKGWIMLWKGLGYELTDSKWKCGLYNYKVWIGRGNAVTGTFSVY